MQFGFARRELKRLLEFRDGVVSLVLQAERASQRLVSLPLFRSELHGKTQLSNGVVEPAFGLQRLREVGVGDGQRGAKLDQSAEVDDGSIYIALLQQYLPQHILSVSVVRVEFHSFFERAASRQQVSSAHCVETRLVC